MGLIIKKQEIYCILCTRQHKAKKATGHEKAPPDLRRCPSKQTMAHCTVQQTRQGKEGNGALEWMVVILKGNMGHCAVYHTRQATGHKNASLNL